MDVNVGDLLQRAIKGDCEASRQLIHLQREGRALRLYPFGRKGPLDEGATPIVMGKSNDLTIRIEMTNPGPILIKYLDVAMFMQHQMYVMALLWQDFSATDDPQAAMDEAELSFTPELTYKTWWNDEGFVLQFLPSVATIDYGIDKCRHLLASWITFIEQSERPLSDFGFNDEESEERYYDIMDFVVDIPDDFLEGHD